MHRPAERGRAIIRRPFSQQARKRFANLLQLAAKSPYVGERRNALAAARRLARRHGMNLEEAAAAPDPGPALAAAPPPRSAGFAAWRAGARHDGGSSGDKAAWQRAVDEARARGLDADTWSRSRRSLNRVYRSARRRDPISHARVLLLETSIPMHEIATTTGLSIYQVAAMKLRLRKAA